MPNIPKEVNDIGTENQRNKVNLSLKYIGYFRGDSELTTIILQHMLNCVFIITHFLCGYENKSPSTYSDLFPLSESIFEKLEQQMIAEEKTDELIEYYNKMAMIFQTAADKSDRKEKNKTEWTNKAYEYLQKALRKSSAIQKTEYEERMKQLYNDIINKEKYKSIKDILKSRANQYEISIGITLISIPDERISLLHHRKTIKKPS